jgi:hypothetical protein
MDQEDIKVILVVDDERFFLFEGASYARNCDEGINFIIEHERIHQIWLDYNLAGGETIARLLDWLQQQCEDGNKPRIDEVYIHTRNEFAARRMKQIISRWYPAKVVDAHPHTDYMTMMLEQTT